MHSLPGAQVLPVIKGIAEIFRDAGVLRRAPRAGAPQVPVPQAWLDSGKLLSRSWNSASDSRSIPPFPKMLPSDVYRDHVGIHPPEAARATAMSAPRCCAGA